MQVSKNFLRLVQKEIVTKQLITKNIYRLSSGDKNANQKTHFGFETVDLNEQQTQVDSVFHSVASKYDIMNDVMSFGIHRCWKDQFVEELGLLSPSRSFIDGKLVEKPARVLDVAGGTGDISFRILQKHKHKMQHLGKQILQVTVSDINESMLKVGFNRSKEMGIDSNSIQFVPANAQSLPFQDNTFDAYTISFGLRNVPRTDVALKEAYRVLKKGGRLMILEFSQVKQFPFDQLYKQYNFNVIPLFGELITGDKKSYQYLVESIQKFYDQETLLQKIEDAGFKFSNYKNLNLGVVAMHSGFKI